MATVIDITSRCVVRFALANHLRIELVAGAPAPVTTLREKRRYAMYPPPLT